MKFICATEKFNTFEEHVASPYIRRVFTLQSDVSATLTVAACGFYELYVNGEHITRGRLAPYISNTNDYVYSDEYSLSLTAGKNVIALHLGNGLQNNPGGYIWNFTEATFRSAPSVALTLVDSAGSLLLESDEKFKCAPSPITSDDYRFGERYDARLEIPGWCDVDFDDSEWAYVIIAKTPKGEIKPRESDPILVEREISPIAIYESEGAYIYDFGESNAGVCRLTINAVPGQVIQLQHSDNFDGKELRLENVWFSDKVTWERDKTFVHSDFYTSKDGRQTYEPTFTYHGFRYVKVTGITAKQATRDLLKFVVFHSKLNSRGGFISSDETVNTLQEMTRRSDVSNFHHFPTDCPQREKNGWTADAALSAEQMMLNFEPERSYREWMFNIRRAQTDTGSLPGIVPTGGWGFQWGNGPAWDSVLAYLPYFVYLYRGETKMIEESADAFIKYIKYVLSRADERGIVAIGLGDWCQVGRPSSKFVAPLALTDTVMCLDICNKIAVMLEAIGNADGAQFARESAEKFRTAVRENLIDFDTLTAAGECQSSQAMCLYYGVFEESEREAAFGVLLELIHRAGDRMDVGVLGGRVIFHILAEFGYADLAHRMITAPGYPSYANWIERGATTLWESFLPDRAESMNHHFWGDISAWYIKRVAGIVLNPEENDVTRLIIAPSFITGMTFAEGYHVSPLGEIRSRWERSGDDVILTVTVPDSMKTSLKLPRGYALANDSDALVSGKYRIVRK